MRAKLRVCASCEWIFKEGVECPKCQFGSYGAHYVYGRNAYRYALSQKPWYDKKLASYSFKLIQEINNNVQENNCNRPTRTLPCGL